MPPATLAQSHFRPTWAEIDLRAFEGNLRSLARLLKPGPQMLVVLKADGYGHGAAFLGRRAAELADLPLWGFGVSSVEEGVALRAEGLRQPILILGSLYPFESFSAALKHELTPTVASRLAVEALAEAAAKAGKRAAVHLEIDTGMGRTGVSPDTAGDVVREILSHDALHLEGIYTHPAQGESPAATRAQLDAFEKVLLIARALGAKPLAHAANSASLLVSSDAHYDLVRPGLAVYGVAPGGVQSPAYLEPVLSWKTRVVFLKKVPAGTPVSYGATFHTQRPSWLATLPVGYADGYRRAFSGKAQVLLRGRRCPVVGRVTMDQIIVDATEVPGIDVGDEAVLIGAQENEKIGVDELAHWADTIPYEILCGIAARVPRVAVKA